MRSSRRRPPAPGPRPSRRVLRATRLVGMSALRAAAGLLATTGGGLRKLRRSSSDLSRRAAGAGRQRRGQERRLSQYPLDSIGSASGHSTEPQSSRAQRMDRKG